MWFVCYHKKQKVIIARQEQGGKQALTEKKGETKV